LKKIIANITESGATNDRRKKDHYQHRYRRLLPFSEAPNPLIKSHFTSRAEGNINKQPPLILLIEPCALGERRRFFRSGSGTEPAQFG
jgi:hypothetical protein